MQLKFRRKIQRCIYLLLASILLLPSMTNPTSLQAESPQQADDSTLQNPIFLPFITDANNSQSTIPDPSGETPESEGNPQEIQIVEAAGLAHSSFVPDGYELFFNDEFSGSSLNNDKWYPYLLPHWSDAAHERNARARLQMNNGTLKLQTWYGDGYWSPKNYNVKSVIMSGQYSGNAGSHVGLHTKAMCDYNQGQCIPVWNKYANQHKKLAVTKYGYFELRAKACPTGYCAWWMIGFEDDSKKSGEIDILEITHKPETTKGVWKNCVHFGLQKWTDPNLTAADRLFYDNKTIPGGNSNAGSCSDLSEQFRTYGLLWEKDRLTFFIDGVQIKQINESPNYEMLTALDVSDWHNDEHLFQFPIANQFEVDYFRIYKNTRVQDASASMLNGSPGWGHKASHAIDGNTNTYAQSYSKNWDLQVDLKKTHAVEKIVFHPNWANWARNYTIKVKREDGSWSTIKTVNNAGNNKRTFTFNPPVPARYVQLDVTSQQGSYAHGIHEFEVHGKPNLAEDKPVTMLNGSPGWGHVTSRSVDGRGDTYTQSYSEKWDMKIDLGDEASVEQIVYRPNWANYAKNYEIRAIREDGSSTQIARVKNGNQNGRIFYFTSPKKARYIQFNVFGENRSGDYAHAIHEFEVYGTPE
ncbi:MAG: discoidin domain-containing protein [Chloroflexota bacterium]